MASYLPPDTIALAGIHLQQRNRADLNQFLPQSWFSALGSYRQASIVWIAYNGKNVLVVARQPSGVSLGGPGEAVRAAEARHSHKAGTPPLVAEAAPVMSAVLWAVVRGDRALPLSGNFVNVNRLLRFTRYSTAAIDWNHKIDIRLVGQCGNPENARQLEESLRAMTTLAAAVSRKRDLQALLKSIEIVRDASAVHIHLLADPGALGELLR